MPTAEGLVVYGEGEWKIYQGDWGEALEISRKGDSVEVRGGEAPERILLLGEEIPRVRIGGLAVEAERGARGSWVRLRS